MSDSKSDSKMVKLSGIWANKSKDGSTYLSGSVGSARVVILKNNYKGDNENAPDFIMYLAENKKKETKMEDIVSDVPF